MLCHKDGRFMDRVYHESLKFSKLDCTSKPYHRQGLTAKRKSASKEVVRNIEIELVRG